MKNLYLKLTGLFLLVFSLQSQAVSLDLQINPNPVRYGSELVLDLYVSGLGDHAAPSLLGFDVDLNYAAADLSISSIEFSPYLGDLNAFEAIAGFDDSVPGLLNLFEQSFLEASASACVSCTGPYLQDLQASSFLLATVKFMAIGGGDISFSISRSLLTNTNGDDLNASNPAPLNGTIPTPATLWLFLLGALGLKRRMAHA